MHKIRAYDSQSPYMIELQSARPQIVPWQQIFDQVLYFKANLIGTMGVHTAWKALIFQ